MIGTGLSSSLRRAALIAGLVVAIPVLSACTEEDIDWVTAIGEEWGRANGVIDVAGNIDWGLAAQILFGLSSDDPQVHAALDAGIVVSTIEEAQQKALEGAQTGDLEKLDDAIRARTKDWGYHELKAALLMSFGDFAAAEASFGDSESLVRRQIDQGGDCRNLARNMYTHRINALEIQLGLQPNEQLEARAVETQAFLDALSAGQAIPFCS